MAAKNYENEARPSDQCSILMAKVWLPCNHDQGEVVYGLDQLSPNIRVGLDYVSTCAWHEQAVVRSVKVPKRLPQKISVNLNVINSDYNSYLRSLRAFRHLLKPGKSSTMSYRRVWTPAKDNKVTDLNPLDTNSATLRALIRKDSHVLAMFTNLSLLDSIGGA